MDNINIDPKIMQLKPPPIPEVLKFGSIMSPIMAISTYKKDEGWSKIDIVPYAPISIEPSCKVLHYGQEIFEGMKAYNVEKGGPYLFRPLDNAKRFNLSAKRMAMPEIDNNSYLSAVEAVTHFSRDLIPKKIGHSLYLRPFMFASENNLGINPSKNFTFIVIASPSGPYISNQQMVIKIERHYSRAAKGGVGSAKTGGNYSASLLSMMEAKKEGCDQVLWLDSNEHKFIQELSGMNFFIFTDNKLITPKINDSILNGITRNSIIAIAKYKGIEAVEDDIAVNDLLDLIESKKCTEAFACGTATIIIPIEKFIDNKKQYPLKDKNISNILKKEILDIQEGRSEDPFNWRHKIKSYS